MSRPRSERQHQAFLELVQRSREAAEQARQERFDEFLVLVQGGASAEDAARRLGTNARAMQRQAYRWHRKDIVQYLSSAAYRQRHGR